MNKLLREMFNDFLIYGKCSYTDKDLDAITEDVLPIPDIRNKLTPITTLISLLEVKEFEMIEELLPVVKENINYLVNREIYKLK